MGDDDLIWAVLLGVMMDEDERHALLYGDPELPVQEFVGLKPMIGDGGSTF